MKFKDLPLSVLLIAVTVIYYGAAEPGLSMAFMHTNVLPVWPPTGVALAAILLLGYRASPGILLGAFLANLATGGYQLQRQAALPWATRWKRYLPFTCFAAL